MNTTSDGPTLVVGGRVLLGFDGDDRARWLPDGGVVVRDGAIEAVGDAMALRHRYPGVPVVGGEDFLVMPGMVNAHHHVGLTPTQLGSPDRPLELWFATRLGLRDVDLELDTLYSAMEMIASGVTTVQHLHSRVAGGADAVLDAAEAVLGAYRRIGMRVSYSMALRDQNRLVYGDDAAFTASSPARLRPALEAYFRRFALPLDEQLRVFHELRARHGAQALSTVQLAPANLHWLSDGALETIAGVAAATGVPMHMHVLETPYQQEYARRRTGGSAVAHLDRLGMLTGAMTIGHGVWMSDADIDLIAAAGVRVCHNCSSNMRLASGRAAVPRMVAAGIPVAIGIDEAGLNDDRDMLQEVRLVAVANREPGLDAPRLRAGTVLRMATEHGAATTGFSAAVGRLDVGRAADLLLLDWRHVTYPYQSPLLPAEDVIVHRARSGAVHSAMINGSWVLRDRTFVTVDRAAVLDAVARSLRADLTDAERARIPFAADVECEVRAFYRDYPEPVRVRVHPPAGGMAPADRPGPR